MRLKLERDGLASAIRRSLLSQQSELELAVSDPARIQVALKSHGRASHYQKTKPLFVASIQSPAPAKLVGI